MLPNTFQSHAIEIAERIRKEISDVIIVDDFNHQFSITASIGVSTWQPDPKQLMTFEQIQDYLINKADNGVYIAKDKGRNRVQIGD